MSTPATETKPAEEQQVPKAEVKEEPETATATSTEATATAGAEPSSMEVDASTTETKTEAASGEEAKPAVEGEGAKTGDAKPRQIRLNGAARKRFRWLLDQGYSKEEAAELAKEPLKTKELRDRFNADTRKGPKPKDEKAIEAEVSKLSPGDKKRFSWLLQNGHTEEEALEVMRKKRSTAPKRNVMSSSAGGPPLKMPRPQPVDVLPGTLAMAVVAKDYPANTLTHVQSNEVKAAILKEVVQQKDAETKPRFESCTYVQAGYLRVNCSDGATRQWLHKIVGKLGVPEGIPLKMVNERNLLKGKGDVFTGVFPDSKKEDNDAILEFVKSQNDGLDISKWKVLSRKELQSKQSVELMLSVDPASSKSIQKLGDELNYKFNKVHLRKQVKPGDTQGPVASNRNVVARPGGAGGRSMGPPQRRPLNQPRRTSNVFVPVWDNNSMRSNSFSSASTGNNLLNTFGLNNLGNSNGFGMDNNSFGGLNSFGAANNSFGGGNNSFGTGSRSFGGLESFARSNSFGNDNNSFGTGSNSFGGGSNSFGNTNSNLYSRRNGGGSGGNQSNGNSNRAISLSASLYDQLKLIGSSGGSNSNGFGSSRRTGGGGGGNGGNTGSSSRRAGGNNNSRSRNSGGSGGGKAPASSRVDTMGKRNFFTTTRTGFF